MVIIALVTKVRARTMSSAMRRTMVPVVCSPSNAILRKVGVGDSEVYHLLSVARESHGKAPGAPRSGRAVEHAGAPGPTRQAAAVRGEVPGRHDVPVAPDDLCAARVAVGAAAPLVVDVAGVGV